MPVDKKGKYRMGNFGQSHETGRIEEELIKQPQARIEDELIRQEPQGRIEEELIPAKPKKKATEKQKRKRRYFYEEGGPLMQELGKRKGFGLKKGY